MFDILLKNEFVVMAIDAILHMASVVVFAVIVILASKLLSRGHVDAKLFTGLLIAILLVIIRVFMLNNISVWLPGVDGVLLMILVVISIYIGCFILVYKLISIPVPRHTLELDCDRSLTGSTGELYSKVIIETDARRAALCGMCRAG